MVVYPYPYTPTVTTDPVTTVSGSTTVTFQYINPLKERLFIVPLYSDLDYDFFCAVWATSPEDARLFADTEHPIGTFEHRQTPLLESSHSIPVELDFEDGVSDVWRVLLG